MEFSKNFWIKFLSLVILLVIVAVGILYWRLLAKKPEFHPITMALGSDENTAHIVSIEGLAVFDNIKKSISLASASFGPNADVVASKVDSRIYIADRLKNKIFVYKDGILLKEITVGARPGFIFLNNKEQKLFVLNKFSKNLNVIDTKNYNIIATIEISSDVLGGVLDEKSNYLYLMVEDGRLLMISSNSLKISKVISVSAFPGDYEKTPFDEINQRMYFVSKSDGNLWVIDTAFGKVINSKQISLGSEVMTIGSTKKKLYIANPDKHAVFVFDADTFKVEKISLSPLLYPIMALADEEGGRLYVYNRSRVNEITVLDMKGNVVKNIPLGYPLSDFQFSYKTKTLYALSNAGGFMLTVKDGKEDFYYKKPEIVETKLNWPNILKVGPFSKRLYALSNFSNNYLAFEPGSLRLVGELRLSGGPYDLAYAYIEPLWKSYVINSGIHEIWRIDSTNDGKISIGKKIKTEKNIFSGTVAAIKKLYVTSDDSIIVVDAKKDEIIKTIVLNGKPKIAGVDQERNEIFINIDNNLLAAIDGNSDAVKNSIKIDIDKIWFDRTNSHIYVLGANDRILNVIDSVNLKILKSINFDISYNEMAAAPWLQRLYLLSSSKNELLILDSDSLKKVALVEINKSLQGIVPQATGIYSDEKTNKIFLTHHYGQITVIDAASNEVVNTIKLPYASNPISLITDPDNSRLYVANKWSNNVQIYDLKDYLLQAEINIKGETQWFR